MIKTWFVPPIVIPALITTSLMIYAMLRALA